MISKRKNEEKDNHPNPGTESKLESIAQSFKRKIQFRKASGSKANVKKGHGGKSAEGPIHISSRYPLPSAPGPPSVDPSSDEIDPSAYPTPTGISTPLRNQHQQVDLSQTNISGSQAIRMRSFGSHNRLYIGDDYKDNKGIIVTGKSNTVYIGERSASPPFKLSSIKIALIFMEATQQVFCDLFGSTITNRPLEFEENGSEGKLVQEYTGRLIKSIKCVLEGDGPTIQQELRDHLSDLSSGLFIAREQFFAAADDFVGLSRNVAWKLRLFLLVIHVAGHIPPPRLVDMVKKRIAEVRRNVEAITSWQSAQDLPCARAAYDDYVSGSHRRASCFEGTRQALLNEMAEWIAKSEAGIFVLFGLAGIGKSTIAQTIAERADNVQLLGASFFFSRTEAERRTAEKFFATIAFQLCLHDTEYAEAIGKVVRTDTGKGTTGKHPLEQLEVLILEPLRDLARRTVLIVIDALDECDESDGPIIVQGLNRLVQCLSSFKVILTTRPQQHLQLLLEGQMSQKVFHLHNIEDRIVDGDIELYLRHKLSLEQVKVHLPKLRSPWSASNNDIESLVRGAGRLFIIASTAVLFILDKTSTPSSRMKELRMALDRGFTPFNKLNDFYNVILRNAVPKDCEPDTAKLYQLVIGSIILLQQPLPVSVLANLVNVEVDQVTSVLGNLESVIMLGTDDIPVVYHKSFPDYIQDPGRCKDTDLHIDPMFHHTRMTIHCLRLSNRCLKQNIMHLGDPAQFMDNDEALEKQGLTESDIQEKIPSELRYACSYFGNHIQDADEDADLVKELERFFDERFLHWLEALSWIGKLDTAHHTILTVQNLKQLKLTSSDLRQLVADGQRFVWRFYDLIRRSALHTYHSALPLAPTETSFYMKYSKQMTCCRVQGGSKTWDAIVTDLAPLAHHVAFAQNSAFFACTTERQRVDRDSGNIIRDRGFMTIHDAVAGIPLGRIEGVVFAISNDFLKAAAFDDGSITLYSVKGVTPIAIIKPSVAVVKLVLSPDGSRLVAGLDDDTVILLDTEKCEQIKSYGRWKKDSPVIISSDGSRTAIVSCDEVIQLLDVMNEKIIADLRFQRLQQLRLTFSGDSSRLAYLGVQYRGSDDSVDSTLSVWNTQDGTLIGMAEDVGHVMATSTDGTLIATGWKMLKLWSGSDLALLETPSLDLDWIWSLAFHNDMLGIGSQDFVALYDINSRVFIARLPFSYPSILTFSADGSRLAAGGSFGGVRLWDAQSIRSNLSQEDLSIPTRLAFSPDCSRLASCYIGGTIKLWDTSNMTLIAAHNGHPTGVRMLEFSVDSGKFASSWSEVRKIQLWDGKDGMADGVLECSEDSEPRALALSSSMLAAATDVNITLWDLSTYSTIATLDQCGCECLTFSQHYQFLAAATVDREEKQNHQFALMLWDIKKQACIATFNLPSYPHRMRLLPDVSQVALQCSDDSFHLFHPRDSRHSIISENDVISRLGMCPSWHGIPVWTRRTNHGHLVLGRFQQQEKVSSVFDCTSLQVSAVGVGSAMLGLGCKDGHIRLLKAVYD